MSAPVSLSTLLAADIPFEWHDAVAIAAQLLDQVRSDIPHPADTHIPDLSGITLEQTGTLSLVLQPGQTVPLMPGAAQLLQRLLSGREQPTLLRRFVMQAVAADPPPPVDQFVQELARWERPNRLQKLAALYSRAAMHLEAAASPVPVPESPAPAPQVHTVSDDRRTGEQRSEVASRRKEPSALAGALIVAGALLAGVAAGAVGWVIAARPRTAVAGALPPDRPGAPTTATETQAREVMDRAHAMFARQQYADAAPLFARVVELLRAHDSASAAELRSAAGRMGDISHAAVVESAGDTGRVEFRAGDPGVVDPVPLSPVPAAPRTDIDASRLGVIELHIDERGAVESARIVLDQPGFPGQGLVRAASAWRFTPATKGGVPVRFVRRLVLDDSAVPGASR